MIIWSLTKSDNSVRAMEMRRHKRNRTQQGWKIHSANANASVTKGEAFSLIRGTSFDAFQCADFNGKYFAYFLACCQSAGETESI